MEHLLHLLIHRASYSGSLDIPNLAWAWQPLDVNAGLVDFSATVPLVLNGITQIGIELIGDHGAAQ